ncbi:MAG: hypothetical protein ACJ72N_18215 [Labedaea sp.]
MSEPGRAGEVERGAAEENTGVPLDDMEREMSKPPEQRWADHREPTSEPADPGV